MPVHTIASNAGVEGAVVVGKLLEQDNPDLGYDAAKGLQSLLVSPLSCRFLPPIEEQFFTEYIVTQSGEYVDMVKAGVIDPLKVIRTALVDAAR